MGRRDARRVFLRARIRDRRRRGGRAVVEIGMRPSAEEAYEGAVAFRVEEGRGCDVACVGEGTLDEVDARVEDAFLFIYLFMYLRQFGTPLDLMRAFRASKKRLLR